MYCTYMLLIKHNFSYDPLSAFQNVHRVVQPHISNQYSNLTSGPNNIIIIIIYEKKKQNKTKLRSKSMSHNAINLLHLYAVGGAAWLFNIFFSTSSYDAHFYGALFWVASHPHPSITHEFLIIKKNHPARPPPPHTDHFRCACNLIK